MSDYIAYIKVPVYEREWCEFHFGNPAVFPAQSNLNAVLRHFLRLRPADAVPEQQQDGELAVALPDSQSKRVSSYNYLTKPARRAVAEAIDDLFVISMYEALTGVGARSVQLTALVEDWMHANGISMDQEHNLRMKFYRIRDSYRSHGINISRGYKHESKVRKKR